MENMLRHPAVHDGAFFKTCPLQSGGCSGAVGPEQREPGRS